MISRYGLADWDFLSFFILTTAAPLGFTNTDIIHQLCDHFFLLNCYLTEFQNEITKTYLDCVVQVRSGIFPLLFFFQTITPFQFAHLFDKRRFWIPGSPGSPCSPCSPSEPAFPAVPVPPAGPAITSPGAPEAPMAPWTPLGPGNPGGPSSPWGRKHR